MSSNHRIASADPLVAVSIVTYNSAALLRSCVERVWAQRGVPLEVIVVDNASADDSLTIARKLADKSRRRDVPFRVLAAPRNGGYGAGHNIAIRSTAAPFVLALNPDALLAGEGTLAALFEALRRDRRAAAAGPRLSFKNDPARLESTGLVIRRDRRVVDRDKEKHDTGQHDSEEAVFGLTGAAILYRRAALEDVKEESGEYFDESLFMYREDVDIAWRLNWLGWRHRYCPSAAVLHGRSTSRRVVDRDTIRRTAGRSVRERTEEGMEALMSERRSIGRRMLYYSHRNHFLTMIKNEHALHFLRDVPWIALRELLLFVYLLFHEPSTLSAYWGTIKASPLALKKRRYIKKRRRVHWREVDRWFAPVGLSFWGRLIAGYVRSRFRRSPRHHSAIPS